MTANMPSIRVLVVENQPIMLDALKHILDEQEDMALIGALFNTDTLIEAVVKTKPHIILLNLEVSLPVIKAILKAARETSSLPAQVIMFCVQDSVSYVWMVLTAGVSAYLNTTETADELLKGIRAVARGESYVNKIMHEAEAAEDFKLESDLTPRQIEVIRQVARGKTNEEIAANLFIRVSTVKKHVSGALTKLGADNRTEAGYRAKQLGLLNERLDGAAAGSAGGAGKRRRRPRVNKRKSSTGSQQRRNSRAR